MKIGIITICNSNYLIHFETFYKSFLLNETNNSVILEHFYIYTNQNEINQSNKRFSNRR